METATFASMLVDCANYYRALHQSISKAQHSIFVLGWDIDSRIELLREGEAEHNSCPNTFFELIKWKALNNPKVMIYLNRWDYSAFMAVDRENFSTSKWKSECPENVFFKLDDQLPLGASHHQKVVVVDDEIAFCGGMDVAIGRWDHRQHHPKNKSRVDPEGNLKTGIKRFGPYHDVQIVVAGPAALSLAQLARKRWRAATDFNAIPIRKSDSVSLPEVWPKVKVDFSNVDTAVALTMPPFKRHRGTRQIERLYLDMISVAEHFIYMENQFFSRKNIAVALNKRLKQKPGLRILLLSCYDPEGVMEKKSLWHGRVIFRDILEQGGVANRVLMAYPISKEKGIEKPVRIHSKLMIVDDRYLRVGSSNISNRSMAVDTECDLVLHGKDENTCLKIASVRNDLIREHTGRKIDEIDKLVNAGGSVQALLEDVSRSRQHIRRINDEQYRNESFNGFATRFADPEKPLIPIRLVWPKLDKKHYATAIRLILAVLIIIGLAVVWEITPLQEYANPQKVLPLIDSFRNTSWALPAALGFYVLGTLVFFPHVIMTATVVIMFAPIEAFSIAMFGSLISGAIGFVLGEKLGPKSLRAIIGDSAEKISHYAKKGGLVGLTLLRLLPVAPYTIVNLALGMMEVPFITFIVASVLGLLPGTLVSVFLGHSVMELWQNPDPKNLLYVCAGIMAWIAIVVLAHVLGKRWQKKRSLRAVKI